MLTVARISEEEGERTVHGVAPFIKCVGKPVPFAPIGGRSRVAALR
jgi:hypothetical protein